MMQKWELSDYQWEQIEQFFLLKLQNAEEKDVILGGKPKQLREILVL